MLSEAQHLLLVYGMVRKADSSLRSEWQR